MKDYKAQLEKLRASIPGKDTRIYGYQISKGKVYPLKTNYTVEQSQEEVKALPDAEAEETLKHWKGFVLYVDAVPLPFEKAIKRR